MRWKKLCVLAVVAVLAVCTAACRHQQPVEPVQITLMHGWGGASPDHVAMRKIYSDFQQQNPDILMLYDTSPDILVVLDKADNLLAVDRMPDIVSTNGYGNFVSNALARGKVLDLAPYIESDPAFASDINDSVLKTWRDEQGRIYTLPDVLEVSGYWYNEEIFRKAGITVDGTPYTEVKLPATFDELWGVCDKIADWAEKNENGITPIILDSDQTEMLLGASISAHSAEGLAFFQKNASTCPPEALNAALDDIERAYSYYNGAVPSVNDTRKIFFEGKSAIYLNGVWASVELEQAGNRQSMRCAPYPVTPGTTLSYVSSSSGYIIGNTASQKKTEACVRFLKYMLSEDVQRRIAVETRQAPSNPKVSTEWIAERIPTFGRALDICYGADLQILVMNTVLNEKQMSAVQTYISLPNRTPAARESLISIFS